jgi:hypothetical protein
MKARARCNTPHTDAHTEQRARGGTSNDHSGERPTLSPGSASKHASRTRAKQRTHAATNEARSRQEAPPNTGRATTTPDSKHTHSAHKARRAAETDAERRRLSTRRWMPRGKPSRPPAETRTQTPNQKARTAALRFHQTHEGAHEPHHTQPRCRRHRGQPQTAQARHALS